ncbi:hypothetical protein J7E50_03490 [Pedobacter sp. ISL-68]|uniref:hypothetical protein n=1 Tax=unclassified Pedobacter TaxID=2628915 RepID=UPI001BED0747|nr:MULTISPECIES: hypothetical protein [unclassified Pedobacter]MBT2560286.1 hypothetical protein [Pedobacter sp. ISL-64]MBT2589266.1 hypothetical protein [Pedobacter sp. ISL-68]
MKISSKAMFYYFFALLLFAATIYSTKLLVILNTWEEFTDTVTKLFPFVGFMALDILLFTISMYLFRKGYKNGKEKKHIRFL